MKKKPNCPFYAGTFRHPLNGTPGLNMAGFVFPPTSAVKGKITCIKVCGTTRGFHPTCCLNCPKFLSCKLNEQSCPVSKQTKMLKMMIRKTKDIQKYLHHFEKM